MQVIAEERATGALLPVNGALLTDADPGGVLVTFESLSEDGPVALPRKYLLGESGDPSWDGVESDGADRTLAIEDVDRPGAGARRPRSAAFRSTRKASRRGRMTGSSM